MREYQLQCTTSRIGERKKRSTLLNAIDRLRYSATRREYCHPHLVGAPHKRKGLFFYHVSNLFWIFFTTDVYTHLFEQLWKRKRTTGHESFLQLFRKRVFSQTKSSPSANFARRLLFWTRKNTKKVTSNPRYFLSIALFQTPTTRSILDSYHDFVLASRLNFQHIHYSVFPAVVSSSFHLFQIHRLIKTRTKKFTTFMVLL